MKNELLLNITGSDKKFKGIIKNALDCFYAELEHYTTKNKEFDILELANEQSLACMLVNGLIRNDGKSQKISALQEYGCLFEFGSYGRPDIFLRIKNLACYIECKYDKTCNIRKDHWDIKGWLEWDTKAIYNQVINYCKSEKRNDSYKEGCYVVTMVFKLIKDDDDSHYIKAIENKLLDTKVSIGERDWYYSYVGNVSVNGTKGLEIYGTFEKIE